MRIDRTHLKTLTKEDLPYFVQQCRDFLLASVNVSGGHLAASLGATELAIALHYVFDTPRDTLVWDVGHQAYVHKMLTGRAEQLHTIKQANGLAPFPSRAESTEDAFGVGHASTSISAALGMALAKQLDQDPTHTIAIIGDGGLTGGMAFEALNHAGHTQANLLVVVSDNEMSISENVGALANNLHADFFTALGFAYTGIIDGNDIHACVAALQEQQHHTGPRVLHCRTRKGQGYKAAEQQPITYHHVAANFLENTSPQPTTTFSTLFGAWLCQQAENDEKLIAITPAMCEGSDLKQFAKDFPQRYIDVGIAEPHALTLAAGLACQGKKPVVAIYSTFLQRAYDQVIHDIALQNLDVTLAVDRAGYVGPDGPTHTGAYDMAFLRCIPNIALLAPATGQDCHHMLQLAYAHPGPAAVRYPRGATNHMTVTDQHDIEWGKGKILHTGKDSAVINIGTMLTYAEQLATQHQATLVDLRFIKPLDIELLSHLANHHQHIITLEDGCTLGGAGSAVTEALTALGYAGQITRLGHPDSFMDHAPRSEQLQHIINRHTS